MHVEDRGKSNAVCSLAGEAFLATREPRLHVPEVHRSTAAPLAVSQAGPLLRLTKTPPCIAASLWPLPCTPNIDETVALSNSPPLLPAPPTPRRDPDSRHSCLLKPAKNTSAFFLATSGSYSV
ncbi:hypothetical protein BS78_03G357400 [Paspalum vaginatum]|nr:hypothetical protein BS78_03G357400 [Paspalum vaginatum]